MNKILQEEQLIRGFVFACTEETESECISRLLFGTEKGYGQLSLELKLLKRYVHLLA
jgi:hypothetical protein